MMRYWLYLILLLVFIKPLTNCFMNMKIMAVVMAVMTIVMLVDKGMNFFEKFIE